MERNSNRQVDYGEKICTEDVKYLFMLKNLYFCSIIVLSVASLTLILRLIIKVFRLAPSTYRLDIDPAGAPIGWKAKSFSHASCCGETRITVPFIPSYIVAGIVTDLKNNPVPG